MERTTQGGLQLHVTGRGQQRLHDFAPGVHHLLRFLKENGLQIIIIRTAAFDGRGRGLRRRCSGECLQGIQRAAQASFVVTARRVGSALRRVGKSPLLGQGCHGGDLVKLARDGFGWQRFVHQGAGPRCRHRQFGAGVKQQIDVGGGRGHRILLRRDLSCGAA